jgi:hypothetical protein
MTSLDHIICSALTCPPRGLDVVRAHDKEFSFALVPTEEREAGGAGAVPGSRSRTTHDRSAAARTAAGR